MTDKPTMLASELVAALQKAIAERGDLPVYLDDPDTCWPLPIEFDPAAKQLAGNYPDKAPCMSIVSDYLWIR